MELKCRCFASLFRQGCVSIVPLWNWNVDSQIVYIKAFFVSIVPLWNWNMRIKSLLVWLNLFQSYLYGIEISTKIDRMNTALLVSIVPLWNWNIGVEFSKFCQPCFNRTFMELKYCLLMPFLTLKHCFNRTFMELKSLTDSYYYQDFWFQSYLYGIEILVWVMIHLMMIVSIVPLWNWNMTATALQVV